MSEEKKLLNANLTVKNIDRIDEVAKNLFEAELSGKKPNRSKAADLLIRLGYHAWHILTENDNPNVEEQIVQELKERGYGFLLCKKEENTDA